MGQCNSPEHLHVIVNHLPLIGVGAALIPLLIGIIARQRPLTITGLAMLALFSATTAIAMSTGEETYERFEHGPLTGMLDPDGEAWMHIHEDRAHLASKAGYATAGLAGLMLLLVAITTKTLRLAGTIALLAGVATVAGMVWVADSGGKIRHPEFRSGPPPQINNQKSEDHP